VAGRPRTLDGDGGKATIAEVEQALNRAAGDDGAAVGSETAMVARLPTQTRTRNRW